jgi:hypothetical protein
MARLSSSPIDIDVKIADMTTTLLTRRRVIDLLRTASATCR